MYIKYSFVVYVSGMFILSKATIVVYVVYIYLITPTNFDLNHFFCFVVSIYTQNEFIMSHMVMYYFFPFHQRFLPSEFGMDPALMGHALEPGRVTFDDKMAIRKAIEDANIPFTYISANCFAGYFAGNLSQMGTLFPPRDKVVLYGDGNVKGA